MSDKLVANLANLPTVHAVKNPAPAKALSTGVLAETRNNLPDGFVLGYSGDALIANVLPAGADAWYSVVAGTIPELAIEIWSARNDPERLSALQTRCTPLWECFNTWGGIRVVSEISRMTGIGQLDLALPLQPLEQDAIAQIDKALQALKVSV